MHPNGVIMMVIMTTIVVHPHSIVPYEWGTHQMKATRTTPNITPPVKNPQSPRASCLNLGKKYNLRLARNYY